MTAPMDAASSVDVIGSHTGACYGANMGLMYCQLVLEYRGPISAPTLDRQCASQGGTYRADCPAENRAGRCTINNALSRQVLNYYAPASASDVQMLCANAGGTFEPG
jgi:hypothetical protein